MENQSKEALSILRKEIYQSRWGEILETREYFISNQLVRIHRFEVEPESANINGGRPFSILLTDGLSDHAVVADTPRTEFVWYVESPQDIHYEWMSFIATVHLVDEVDLFWRTLPIVAEPSLQQPLHPDSQLTSATFINSIISRDTEPMQIEGEETYAIWILPITEAERSYLQDRGEDFGDVLADLLSENKHPFVLSDPLRKSYV